MADIKPQVDFDNMQEPVNVKYVNKPGIYRGMKNVTLTFKEAKPDTPAAEGKEAKKGTKAYYELTMDNVADGVLRHMIFPLPVKEEDVKFFGKVYKDGKELRDMTAAEQINQEHSDLAFFLIQLAMALGSDFLEAKRTVTAGGAEYKAMCDAFIAGFSTDAIKAQSIDVKYLCANNLKRKTSFLGIPKANQRNMVFVKHNPKNAESDLQLSDYEKKNSMTIKFPYGGKKPEGEGGEISLGSKDEGFKAVITDDELF